MPNVAGPVSNRWFSQRYELAFSRVERLDPAGIIEPAGRRRSAPVGLALRILLVPANRLEVGIDDHIVARIELDAVAVGIEDVEEHRVRNAVTARSTFDRSFEVGTSQNIGRPQHVARLLHPEARVMNPRSRTSHHRDVVDVLLAMQPGGPQMRRNVVRLGVLRALETERVTIPGSSGVTIRHMQVEVVDAHHMRALVDVEALEIAFDPLDVVIELDRKAEWVLNPQRSPLSVLFSRLNPATG